MTKRKGTLDLSNIVSVIIVVLLLLVFTVATRGALLAQYCLKSILEQSIFLILGGLGMVFVVAQGSMDMSQGSVLAASATLGLIVSVKFGASWYVPTALAFGLAVGLLNGFIVSKLKVSSFMTTIAFLIALRVFQKLLLSNIVLTAPAGVRMLNNMTIKAPVLIAAILILGYVYELTHIGRYSKAIGENEMVVRYAGVNVDRLKMIAFALSGLMGAVVGVFMLSRQSGSSMVLGNIFELKVMMALFIGGIPVNGGMSSRVYKLLIGSVSISILENGLSLMGASSFVTEMIEGIVLLGIVGFILFLDAYGKRLKPAEEEKGPESPAPSL